LGAVQLGYYSNSSVKRRRGRDWGGSFGGEEDQVEGKGLRVGGSPN